MLNFDKFNTLLNDKGMSKAFVARKIGKVRTFFSDLQKGKTSLNDEQLKAVADLLDTTPEYLTDKTDKKEKPNILTDEQKLILYKLEKLSPENSQIVVKLIDFLLSDYQ